MEEEGGGVEEGVERELGGHGWAGVCRGRGVYFLLSSGHARDCVRDCGGFF